ncbi:MAG: YciI family protein [bacterium]|nr:YciI family protein [bacterium]
MQFVVIGLDGVDTDAPSRRQAVRQDHIKMGEKLLISGNLWYGAALLHDDGTMKGSVYVVDFSSETELQNWLDREPYVVGDVWREITIHKSNTRDPWQFNRDREWFEKREA